MHAKALTAIPFTYHCWVPSEPRNLTARYHSGLLLLGQLLSLAMQDCSLPYRRDNTAASMLHAPHKSPRIFAAPGAQRQRSGWLRVGQS